MFKVGDLVYVSNPDTEYEKEYGERTHKSFFGTVTEVTEYKNGICVEVKFPVIMQTNYHLQRNLKI